GRAPGSSGVAPAISGGIIRTDTLARSPLRARRGAAAPSSRRRPMAAPIRLSLVSTGVADRDGSWMSLPLFVLFGLAAPRPRGAPALDRERLSRLRRDRSPRVRRRRPVLVSARAKSGTGNGAEE